MTLKICKRCMTAKHIRGKKLICKRCEEEFDKENINRLQYCKHCGSVTKHVNSKCDRCGF